MGRFYEILELQHEINILMINSDQTMYLFISVHPSFL